MNRKNFYFDQLIGTSELSELQDGIERADKNLAKAIIGSGVLEGLDIIPNDPMDLTVRFLHGVAFDDYGQRIESPGDGIVDCSSYAVSTVSNERWLTIVARFARNVYDERQDGNGSTVLYQNDEYFEVAVLTGATALNGSATKPVISVGDVLLADVRRYYGQSSIQSADIDVTRRMIASSRTVTDDEIGDRTITDTMAPTNDSARLTTLLSNLGNMIKIITGKSNWRTAPAATIEVLNTNKAPLNNPVFTGTVTLPGDPAAALHAATKQYVDAMAQGLSQKQSVKASTTANITLSGTQTIDGVVLAVGDRVLAKNQTTASQNGIYVVASGAWTRATDADTSAEVAPGMYVFVEQGTLNVNSGWVLTTPGPITLGTTNLTFVQFSGMGQISPTDGLYKIGNSLGISDNGVTDVKIGNRTISDTTAPTTDTASLITLLSNLGNMIKAITGKTNWRIAPAATIEALNTDKAPLNNPVFTGAVTLPGDPSAALHAATKQYVDVITDKLNPKRMVIFSHEDSFGISSAAYSNWTTIQSIIFSRTSNFSNLEVRNKLFANGGQYTYLQILLNGVVVLSKTAHAGTDQTINAIDTINLSGYASDASIQLDVQVKTTDGETNVYANMRSATLKS